MTARRHPRASIDRVVAFAQQLPQAGVADILNLTCYETMAALDKGGHDDVACSVQTSCGGGDVLCASSVYYSVYAAAARTSITVIVVNKAPLWFKP